jgi:hypothetical protein
MDKIPMFPLLRAKKGPIGLESVISALIFFLIIIIGILIFFQQFRYDEKEFNDSVMQSGDVSKTTDAAGSIDSFEIAGLEPEGYTPMSDQESFDQATLSDKIDGKADT